MDHTTFQERRRVLRDALSDGAILLIGSALVPRNFRDNVYPFRQDSHFLYYVGVNEPDMAALLLPDGREVLYCPAEHPDDLIWFGPHATADDHRQTAGISDTGPLGELAEVIAGLRRKDVPIHYLPPYREDRSVTLAGLLGIAVDQVDAGVSAELVQAVVAQRSIKSDQEVAEIEAALAVTAEMYRAAMLATAPGKTEAEIAAALVGPVLARGWQPAFPPIVTIRGEVLHNTSYANTLADGDLLLIDSGAEAGTGYASDITRTFPVSGRFSPEQAAIYEIVLRMQQTVIDNASPRVSNRQLHLQAARVAAEGLRDLGLMRGNPDDAVAAGAHGLFFVHGIGHMMGLDVHDMEDLGDVVGYPQGEARSSQFGLCFLRLAKQLEPGFVLTDEPGLYFVPALIDRWQSEGRHSEFICYDAVERFRSLGGIRIEDNLLITADGARVLGPGIPKTIPELQAVLAER